MTRVGVISDTHGLLRPQALEALAGSDLILHAGDVGNEQILEALRRLAPVRAVRGNTDREGWAWHLPGSEALEVEGVSIYLHHGHEALELDPAAGGVQVVVSGHTHQPLVERRGGVLYLNPGSAGPKRFKLPVSLARLVVQEGWAEAEVLELGVRGLG